MAFIPDEAIFSGAQVPQSAFRVYACYCSHRNHETETSRPSRALISQEAGVNVSYVSVCKSELIKKGWIEVVEGDEVRLLKGDFEPVNKKKTAKASVGKSNSFTAERVRNSNSIPDSQLENQTEELEIQTGPVGNSNRPYIEPENSTRTENQTKEPEVGASAAAQVVLISSRKPKPTTGRARAAPDPRSDHPAIQLVRSMMSRFPDKLLYDDIIKILGDEPDTEHLIECRKAWITAGYNTNSLTWVVEWYVNGIPERFRQNGNTDGKSKQQTRVDTNGRGSRQSADQPYDPWSQSKAI